MSHVFLRVVDLSLNAGLFILAVLLLRLLLKRVSRNYFVILWVLVMLRFLCTLPVSGRFQIPLEETIPEALSSLEAYSSEAIDNMIEQTNLSQYRAYTETGIPLAQVIRPVLKELLAYLWLVGAVIFLLNTCIKTIRLRINVKGAVNLRDNVYLCSGIRQSFVLGIVKPKIYIPAALGEERTEFVLEHEKEHIRHGDHIFKLLFYMILMVHWFNPLCHVAYKLFSEDLEIACDERTIRSKNMEYRANYLQTLLDCTAYESNLTLGLLSFSDVGIKGRIKRIMAYRKSGIVELAIWGMACLIPVFYLMTNDFVSLAKAEESSTYSADYKVVTPGKAETVSAPFHWIPGTSVPCDNTGRILVDAELLCEFTGEHAHSCKVTNQVWSHKMYCTSCKAYLGIGQPYSCTEIHTCGSYVKDCTPLSKARNLEELDAYFENELWK